MALSVSWNHHLIRTTTITPCTVVYRQQQNQRGFSVSVSAQGGGESRNVSRVWRRRKLKRKDDKLRWTGINRTPVLFLEERINKIKDSGQNICYDINMMLLREENRFDFVNEVIAEANELLDKDPDAYGSKKPVYHALTNRLNGKGSYRHEAYIEPNPFNIKRHGIRHQPFFL